jgi:hypothetical protein
MSHVFPTQYIIVNLIKMQWNSLTTINFGNDICMDLCKVQTNVGW